MEERARDCVELACSKGVKLALAESCTGGLVSASICAVPGASRVFLGGVIAYSDRLKRDILGIDAGLLSGHGAVSELVSREMARGVRELCGADLGISVTGIAGPGGGVVSKPVGLVHMAASILSGQELHRECRFGDIGRDRVSFRSLREVLELIHTALRNF